MNLLTDLQELGQHLPPSHQIDFGKIGSTLSALLHYLEDPEGLLQALHNDEGAAAGVLAHITSKANAINETAQRDLASAQGLTNVPTYEELIGIYKQALVSGNLPPAQPVAPPVSSTATVENPGAPAPGLTPVEVPAAQPPASSGAPGIQPSVVRQPSAPAFTSTPTPEQLGATVDAQQQHIAQLEAQLQAATAAAGGGAVQAGNQATTEQPGPIGDGQ